MACNRTPVECAGERANDTCTNKDREVKAILRVSLGCYKLEDQFRWSTHRLANILHPALVALRSAYQRPVNPTH